MNRQQMIAAAVDALTSASWPDHGRDGFPSLVVARMLAPAILDAVLPRITTYEELDALPDGTLLASSSVGVFKWRAGLRLLQNVHDGYDYEAKDVLFPLTVVWQP